MSLILDAITAIQIALFGVLFAIFFAVGYQYEVNPRWRSWRERHRKPKETSSHGAPRVTCSHGAPVTEGAVVTCKPCLALAPAARRYTCGHGLPVAGPPCMGCAIDKATAAAMAGMSIPIAFNTFVAPLMAPGAIVGVAPQLQPMPMTWNQAGLQAAIVAKMGAQKRFVPQGSPTSGYAASLLSEPAPVPFGGERIGYLVGWRSWKIEECVRFKDGKNPSAAVHELTPEELTAMPSIERIYALRAINYDAFWMPGEELVAECYKAVDHKVPDESCSCGIYAWASAELLLSSSPGWVFGPIAMWGDVLECGPTTGPDRGALHGYRSSHAYPLALFILPPAPHQQREPLLRELERYNVKVTVLSEEVHQDGIEGRAAALLEMRETIAGMIARGEITAAARIGA